jgi:hypothetical protein
MSRAQRGQEQRRQRSPVAPEVRVARLQAARAKHWRRTGVSEDTVRWMREEGML